MATRKSAPTRSDGVARSTRGELKERTRRNVELWAACIAGAIPRDTYVRAIEAEGFQIQEIRRNDYRFVSERALDACTTYEVESISLLAIKRA